MSKILIATRKDNVNYSLNEKLQKELDCEFVSMDARQLLSDFKEKKSELVVLYLSRISDDEDIEVSRFLSNSKEIPVILVGDREILARYYQKSSANIMRYIATPLLLSAYIDEVKRILRKVEAFLGKNIELAEEKLPEDSEIIPPKKILVIDDDIVTLRTINNWLSEFFSVSLARGCIEAFKYFKKGNVPDLILLDYDMPEYDGIETLKQIRSVDALKNVPVFFLTGVDDAEYIKQALVLKPQGYILKSNGSDYLISKIQQYL